MEAQQLRATPGDIAVTAEIPADLPGKGVGSKQQHAETRTAQLARKSGVGQKSAVVCNHALAQKSGKDQQHTVEKPIGIERPPVLNLRKQMRRPLNGTGNQV